MIEKKQFIGLLVGLGLFLTAFIFHEVLSGNTNVRRYKKTIESYLWEQESEVNRLMADTAFINTGLKGQHSLSKMEEFQLAQYQNKDYVFCIYRTRESEGVEDSLVFWSNQLVLPHSGDLPKTVTTGVESRLTTVKESIYELRYKSYEEVGGDRITLAALLPIKKIYTSFEGEYLKDQFPASKWIPSQLQLTDTIRAFDVKTIEQKPICYLNATNANFDREHDIVVVLFLIASLIAVGHFGEKLSRQINREYQNPLYGMLFFMLIFFGMYSCVYYIEKTNLLVTFELATNSISGTAGFIRSVPDLIINTIFLFWLSIFIHKELRFKGWDRLGYSTRLLMGFGCYFCVVFLYGTLIGVFKELTTNLSITLAFKDLFDLQLGSVAALLALGLMIVSVFLLTHRLICCVNELDLSKLGQFLALDCAIAMVLPFFYTYKLPYFVLIFVGSTLFFIFIFHSFTKTKKPNISWLLVWLIIYSAIPAIFISRFNIDKEGYVMGVYASILAREQDEVAIESIHLLQKTISEDAFLTATQTTFSAGIVLDTDRINKVLENHYNKDSYLTNHYDFHYFGLRRVNDLALKESEADMGLLAKKRETAKPNGKYSNIYFWTDKKGDYSYLTNASLSIPTLGGDSLRLFLEFKRHDKLNSRVFTELSAMSQFKKLKDLKKYSYAIYKDKRLVEQNRNDVYENILTSEEIPPVFTPKITIKDEKIKAVYNNPEGFVAILGFDVSFVGRIYTLATYIFLLLFLTFILLAALDHFVVKFLPNVLRISFSFKASFLNQIQLPILSLICVSFSAIGVAIVWFFLNQSETYRRSDLEKLSDSMASFTIKEIHRLDSTQLKPTNIKDVLKELSDKSATAIHYFDESGLLVATTEDNLFNKGIISNRINPLTYFVLKSESKKVARFEEHIGSFHYQTSYYPVLDSNAHTMGFLELPIYAGDRNNREDAVVFLSYTISSLIALITLSFVLISIYARRIVDPIKAVVEKLNALTLGHKNEPISNMRIDEIGQFLNAYNSKVKELGETFQRLAVVERESAWRDMAKQVAHEIRNPLTPMKLVVQHMESLRKNRPEHVSGYLERSNKMLLDQIESLEKIVTEFTQFAKMPQANNERFVINGLVSSVSDLFKQSHKEKLDFEMQMASESLFVYADWTLLVNAFNNLITNAIQSIPEDRMGKVKVSLYKTETSVVVKISDNGVGIPKDIQDKIFSPNFTTKSYGNGLGLLITKNIIQSVNGKVYFETEENIGTDFFVELDLINE